MRNQCCNKSFNFFISKGVSRFSCLACGNVFVKKDGDWVEVLLIGFYDVSCEECYSYIRIANEKKVLHTRCGICSARFIKTWSGAWMIVKVMPLENIIFDKSNHMIVLF